MPVDLKKIPGKVPLPVAPDKFRWLIIIALIIIAGATLVLALWPDEFSTHSGWFWFCLLALPISTGLVTYTIRLIRYENERDRVTWWNQLHQKLYQETVLLGQQAVGVLGMSYITPVASNKLAFAMLQGNSVLNTHYSPDFHKILTTASLSPSLNLMTKSEYQRRLESILIRVIAQLYDEMEQFGGNFFVRIHHEGVLNNEQILAIWQKIFPATFRVIDIHISNDSIGLMWIDDWLDKQDDGVVLSVESNLFLQPCDQQAESVSALLLASPAWLLHSKVKPNMWIHRPIVITQADAAVKDTARWGKLTPEEPWFLLRAQIENNLLAAILPGMYKNNFLSEKKGEIILEDIFGKPQAALGHITLICACEHAVTSGQPQWLILGEEHTQMAIVRPV